jgi:diamine N-acetyltransferase
MSTPSNPAFRAERYDIGLARDRRAVQLTAMTADTAAHLAPAVAAIGPWAHYNFTAQTLNAFLRGEMGDSHRFEILCDGQAAGAVVVRYPWLAGPYLQMLAVLPNYQGQSIGARVLDWYQVQGAQSKSRQVWLCVTAANTNAQRFYRSHGYELSVTLDGLMRDGDDELLMRKRLKPSV